MGDKETQRDLAELNALKNYTGVDFRTEEEKADPTIRKIIRESFSDPIIIAKYICKDNPYMVRMETPGADGGNILYLYNGKYYDLLTDKDLDAMLMRFCLKYETTKTFKSASIILRALTVYPDIRKVPKMNPFENLICVDNGVVDIYTKELFDHDPKYCFDYALTTVYDVEAKSCPNFIKFLNDALSGEQDTIENIIRLGGYLLDTSCKAEKCFFFDGNGGCLDKDTYISYDVESRGKRINHKGGTIEMLYERFNNKPTARGKGGYHLRSNDKNLTFYVPSVNENNSIFKNRIVDVIKSGSKECFRLTTNKGKSIIATGTHKFFNGKKYVSLKKLSAGDTVYIHNNTHFKNYVKPARVGYKEVVVKYHPSNHRKIVNGYVYYRVKKCRLVVEADMNGLSYEDYVKVLNKCNVKTILTLNKKYDVHHINHNRTDDRLSNLRVMISADHDRLHAAENYNKMRFIAIPDTIREIKSVGKRETYDIMCLNPYNNFIANGLVVHNSGKSTLINAFTMFFPKRVTRPVVTSLSLDQLSENGFNSADLIYSRFNQCAETKKGYYDAEFLKKMVSGDLITVRRIYSEPFTFNYQGKVILVGNGLPRFNDTSDGIYRRIQIITFRNQYKPQSEIDKIPFAKERRIYPIDTELFDKIKLEASSILNLFINGLIDLRENKYQFNPSRTSVLAMDEFRKDSDTVREFLEDNYTIDMKEQIPLLSVFNDFRKWYMENVQDTKSMKFRSAEMGKRIKEVFGLDSCGRCKFLNYETKKYELLTAYNLRLKYKPQYELNSLGEPVEVPPDTNTDEYDAKQMELIE